MFRLVSKQAQHQKPSLPQQITMKRGRKTKQDLYFIQRGGAIKIGIAVDVEDRLRTFETAGAQPAHLIGIVVDGGRELEQALHDKFKYCHIDRDGAGTEWHVPHLLLLWEIFLLTGRLPKFTLPLVWSIVRVILFGR